MQDDFFLLQCVNDVQINSDETKKPYVDSYGHVVQFGRSFIKGKYLETVPSTKINRFKMYEIKKEIVAVEPNTVFFPCVQFDSMIRDVVKFSNDIILELFLEVKTFKPSILSLQFTKLKHHFCFLFKGKYET